VRGYVNYGEIAVTFKRSDIEELKAFITRTTDEVRPPYARTTNRYKRQTVFIGTSNEIQILRDDENRRFWTLNITGVNYNHNINIQQFWAQIKEMYKDENIWWLTTQERELLGVAQEGNKETHPIDELLDAGLKSPSKSGKALNATTILMKLDKGNITKTDTNRAAKWLRNNCYDFVEKGKRWKVEFQNSDLDY